MTKKLIAITGAAGDIGHAMARRFLERGCVIAALDVDEAALAHRLNDVAPGDHYRIFATDVTRPASVAAAFKAVRSEFDAAPDILINNAGGISDHNLRSTTEESWTGDIELNLNGAWRCINAVIRDFVNRKNGVIINMASVNGIGIFGHPGYSVAKAGLIHLTKFAAVELGKYGIRTVAICPGTVKTRAWLERQKQNPSIIDEALSWYPSRMASEPCDVARLVEFVALDAPPAMNGALIGIDGGLSVGHDVVASAFCNDRV